jgi:septum site-determining protein MinC
MKTRQRSVRVFEIITENYDKFIKFATSREKTLKKYLVVVRSENEKIKEYLENSDFEYKIVKPDFEATNEKLEIDRDEDNNHTNSSSIESKIPTNSTKTEIFDRIIRGGEEINSNNRLIFLKRINAGAKIISTESIEIFDEVEGVIICSGEYMIVKKNKKGTILFHNEEIKVDKLSFVSKDGIKEL